MGIVILDLDNTISDDEWRRDLIDWTQADHELRYRGYHEQCFHDEVGNRILFERTPHDIVIFTSRPEWCRQRTESWLLRHNIPAQELFMKANGNTDSSVDIKHHHLQSLLSVHSITAQDIACAYDDHTQVIAMYHGLGVHAECWAINVRYSGAVPTSQQRRRTGRPWR
jgi:hypothetical protein